MGFFTFLREMEIKSSSSGGGGKLIVFFRDNSQVTKAQARDLNGNTLLYSGKFVAFCTFCTFSASWH